METSEIIKRVAQHPLLAVLDADVLASVVRAGKLIHFRARRIILKEDDPPQQAFCLLSGAVRVYHRSANGNEVTVKLFRAPALFGEMEVLAGWPFLEYVITLEPSEIFLMPAAVLVKLLKTQRAFAEALAVDLSLRLCIATHHERALAFCNVDTRLANLLIDYAEVAGEPCDLGVRITTLLTGNSMAHDLAVSRKSVVRALGKLEELALVAKAEGRYVVIDLDALRQRGSGTLGLAYKLASVKAWKPMTVTPTKL